MDAPSNAEQPANAGISDRSPDPPADSAGRSTSAAYDARRARSFDQVVNAYARARPSYPVDAVKWLTGPGRLRVLELGAGTGKLTRQLVELGHNVTATDPSEVMLRRLVEHAPGARPVVGAAEMIPAASRSVEVVLAAQAFHWFDAERALPETARVLGPRGVLGLVWNMRDERVPWVRRLGAILGEESGADPDPAQAVDDSGLFETVQRATFRFWQPMTRQLLRDLVASRSAIAVLPALEQEAVFAQVDELYDAYGRGHDGMLLPYRTRAYRTVVLPWAIREQSAPAVKPVDMGTDSLLIDFR